MPLPPFDSSGALPPFLEEPTALERTPWPATVVDVLDRFATSSARVEILGGWLRYLTALEQEGAAGFQWIDGSFVEDLTLPSPSREPKDLDVVTFLHGNALSNRFKAARLLDRAYCMEAFRCDTYYVNLDASSETIVKNTSYYLSLFSHRRDTFQWKGMIEVSLPTPQVIEDAYAKLTA